MLRVRLGPSLSLRFLLLLGVPDSECREASSKLRRAFTALSFSCCTFSWCTFSAMMVNLMYSMSQYFEELRQWRDESCGACSFPSVFLTDAGTVGEGPECVLMSGVIVGQGSALIARLRIRTLFRRRPTEAVRVRLVILEPCRCKLPTVGLRIEFPSALCPFASVCKNQRESASMMSYMLYTLSVLDIGVCECDDPG
ncbi:hypothetical protein Tco_0821161 [Tanacetum coccineum]|uniref:Secreted protein n=1 Tax=Tanacetum coccineum TaxID=301880 RepID=A0ABQ5AEG4_9ASTR